MRRFLANLAVAASLIAGPAFAADTTAPSSGTKHALITRSFAYAAPGGKMEKGTFLGASASPVSAALREQLGLQKGFGLLVNAVEKGSPAEKAGIQRYDILQKLDDQRLVDTLQLHVLVRSYKANDKVTLALIRKGQPMTLDVTLIEKDVPELTDAQIDSGRLDTNWLWGPGAVKIDAGTSKMDKTMREVFNTPSNAHSGASFVLQTPDQTLEMTTNDGSKQLVVKDKDDNVIFQGPIDTPEQRSKLPPGVESKLKQMESKFASVGEPATLPSEPLPPLPGK